MSPLGLQQHVGQGFTEPGHLFSSAVAIQAFKELRAQGDAGREALMSLFTHQRADVRVAAASFLLRYRTAEAKAVLAEVAQRKGFFAFEAGQALKTLGSGRLEPLSVLAVRPGPRARSPGSSAPPGS
ncbi:DUF2019 domain-containing protein [Corallococcus sp. AS-1-12]|nr:DUF2019 domain-containing protein [Corallococcus sp. AS-1-12]